MHLIILSAMYTFDYNYIADGQRLSNYTLYPTIVLSDNIILGNKLEQ